MKDPEKVVEYVLTTQRDIPAVLNKVRRQMELGLKEGPFVVHIGRQVVDGCRSGDHKDHQQIKGVLERIAAEVNNGS
ncbi:hypothetical protein [Neptunomonas japonica]|uniref:hypothetical protein n=1 Tax=Neptunomonas japonica TaxID=417574 RepID=UPI001916BE6D|nr:hypothetical protein [Neptunomonas japonica]